MTYRFIYITTGRILIPNPRRLVSTHTPGISKGISDPLKAISTQYNLHPSSWGVMRAKTLGGPESKLKPFVHPSEN
jgi:hypothetical protein